MTGIPFHSFSNAFPLMEGPEFTEFVDDIKANGQREPITVYQGQILEGRNRYRACLRLKIEPQFVEFEGDDADAHAFVISRNLRRRHLTPKQKSEAIAKIVSLRPEKSNRALGIEIGVDHKTIALARKKAEAGGEVSPPERIGKDGKAYPATPSAGPLAKARAALAENPDITSPSKLKEVSGVDIKSCKLAIKKGGQTAEERREEREAKKEAKRQEKMRQQNAAYSEYQRRHEEKEKVFEAAADVLFDKLVAQLDREMLLALFLALVSGYSGPRDHDYHAQDRLEERLAKHFPEEAKPFYDDPIEDALDNGAGNDLDPEAAAEKRKAEMAALDVTPQTMVALDAGADCGPMPDCLRRAPC
jgi:hypothetical protein